MTKRSSRSPHAVSGVISLLVLLSAFPILPPIPPFGSSQAEIVDYYRVNVLGGYLYQFIAGLAVLAALWFLGYLYTRLHDKAPMDPRPIIMLASGTAWITIALVYMGLFQIFSIWAEQPEAHSLLRAFSDAYVLGFMFNVFPAAVMVASATWCMRRSTGWPGWFTPFGILVLAIQVLGSVALIFPAGPLKAGGLITYGSFFAAIFWISVISFVLTFSGSKQRSSERL